MVLVSATMFAGGLMLAALITAREAQGLGGGLTGRSRSPWQATSSRRGREKVQDYLSATFAANIIGPLLGGPFIEYLSWRLVL